MNTQKIALKVLVVAVPGMLLLGACGNSASPEASAQPTSGAGDVTGRTFVFTDVTVGDDDSPPPNGGDGLVLSFTDTGIGGTGGCNSLSGNGSVSDGTLNVGDGLAMTEMGCDSKRMDQDTWFADLLTSKPTVTVDGDTLTLTSGGTVLTLTDQETVQPTANLVGPTWTLDSLIDGDSVSTVPQGVVSTIKFDSDGGVFVDYGCNSGNGKYEVAGDVITFKGIATTLMLCAGPKGDVEDAVSKVVVGDVSFSIDGQRLTLTNGTHGLGYTAS